MGWLRLINRDLWVAVDKQGIIYKIAEYNDRKRLKKFVKHHNENTTYFPLRVVKCKLVEVEED